MNLTVSQLAEKIGAQIMGDGGGVISSVGTLEDAGPGQISFLANPKYERLLSTTRATAVIVGLEIKNDRVTLLRTAEPYHALMQAVVLLHGHRMHPHSGIHPQAHIDSTAVVGSGTIVYPGVYVGPRAKVGRDCILYPNVIIYDDCILGDRVILHAGTVIGHDGLGYATHKGKHYKIPQIGIVVLEDDVEIGANTTVQRATLGRTVIARGTKMGDVITIGHGVTIGPDGMLVSQVGIAGSTKIGHHITVGGQAGIVGHLHIGDSVAIAAQSGVVGDIPDQTVVMGSPATPAANGRRVLKLIAQLPDLLERIRALEHQVAELAAQDQDPPEH